MFKCFNKGHRRRTVHHIHPYSVAPGHNRLPPAVSAGPSAVSSASLRRLLSLTLKKQHIF